MMNFNIKQVLIFCLVLVLLSCNNDSEILESRPSKTSPKNDIQREPACQLIDDFTSVLENATPPNTIEDVEALLKGCVKGKVRQYSTYDFGRAKDATARSIILSIDAAERLLPLIENKAGPNYVAFIGTTNWIGAERPRGIEFVIGPGKTETDKLKLSRTDAVNYGKSNEDLVAIFQRWDEECGIHIKHAESDTLELTLKSKPKNIKAYAQEIVDLCPDLELTAPEMEEELNRTNEIYFWWD